MMQLSGNGLERHSHMYFYSPSGMAKKLLYYPLCAGEFYCNDEYIVQRNQYNSFLLLLVLDGEIHFNEHTALEGELLLIDCYNPHTYYTKTKAHTLWLHFDGNNSRELFEEITAQKGQKMKCPANMAEHLRDMIKLIKESNCEYDISKEVYSLLCSLLNPNESDYQNTYIIETAKKYISDNYNTALTVENIAAAVNMSSSYFSRIFKRATTFSPYDYLLNIRLEKAKALLLKTDLPIYEIAYKTGFNSDANFIYFFKKETSLSPLKFRNISF